MSSISQFTIGLIILEPVAEDFALVVDGCYVKLEDGADVSITERQTLLINGWKFSVEGREWSKYV